MAQVKREIYPWGSDSPLTVKLSASYSLDTFLSQIRGKPLGEKSIGCEFSPWELYTKLNELAQTSPFEVVEDPWYICKQVKVVDTKGAEYGDLKLTLRGKEWVEKLDKNVHLHEDRLQAPSNYLSTLTQTLTTTYECSFSPRIHLPEI